MITSSWVAFHDGGLSKLTIASGDALLTESLNLEGEKVTSKSMEPTSNDESPLAKSPNSEYAVNVSEASVWNKATGCDEHYIVIETRSSVDVYAKSAHEHLVLKLRVEGPGRRPVLWHIDRNARCLQVLFADAPSADTFFLVSLVSSEVIFKCRLKSLKEGAWPIFNFNNANCLDSDGDGETVTAAVVNRSVIRHMVPLVDLTKTLALLVDVPVSVPHAQGPLRVCKVTCAPKDKTAAQPFKSCSNIFMIPPAMHSLMRLPEGSDAFFIFFAQEDDVPTTWGLQLQQLIVPCHENLAEVCGELRLCTVQLMDMASQVVSRGSGGAPHLALSSAESVTFLPSPSGLSVAIILDSAVDMSGANYGSVGDLLICGEAQTEPQEHFQRLIVRKVNTKSLQTVAWHPTADIIMSLEGQSSCTARLYDRKGLVKATIGQFYANTIAWQAGDGAMLALGGFGNLAGDITTFRFFFEEKCSAPSTRGSVTPVCVFDYEEELDGESCFEVSIYYIATFREACTVTMNLNNGIVTTASTYPRLKVDNNMAAWTVEGRKLSTKEFALLRSVIPITRPSSEWSEPALARPLANMGIKSSVTPPSVSSGGAVAKTRQPTRITSNSTKTKPEPDASVLMAWRRGATPATKSALGSSPGNSTSKPASAVTSSQSTPTTSNASVSGDHGNPISFANKSPKVVVESAQEQIPIVKVVKPLSTPTRQPNASPDEFPVLGEKKTNTKTAVPVKTAPAANTSVETVRVLETNKSDPVAVGSNPSVNQITSVASGFPGGLTTLKFTDLISSLVPSGSNSNSYNDFPALDTEQIPAQAPRRANQANWNVPSYNVMDFAGTYGRQIQQAELQQQQQAQFNRGAANAYAVPPHYPQQQPSPFSPPTVPHGYPEWIQHPTGQPSVQAHSSRQAPTNEEVPEGSALSRWIKNAQQHT